MSGADDLRTAIARENFYWDGTTRAYWGELDWEDVPESTHEQHLEHADAIIALFAVPVRRLAILNLIGDVTVIETGDYYPAVSGTHYVVRPRGEATDA